MLISILKQSLRFCTSKSLQSKSFTQLQCKSLMIQSNPLRQIMIKHLQEFQELKIDQYWKMALTNNQFGYYQNKNVFSKEGDFTTSPQISSLFGQMIGVWIAYFLQKIGITNSSGQVQKKFRIVELGPGRGLLMRDIVKSLYDIKINNFFEIGFIQVSQFNRKRQQQTVIQQFNKKQQYFKFQFQTATPFIQKFTSEDEFKQVGLTWYSSINDLVKQDYQNSRANQEIPLTIFVANQFFDALPIIVVQYTQIGWRQKVIKQSKSLQFNFQLQTSKNPLSPQLTPIVQNPKIGDTIQLSPQSLMNINQISSIISKNGGALLNIDYGGSHCFSNSIRAIKDHKYVPSPYFWQIPGLCDLSAYVDFGSLSQFAEMNKGIKAYDIIPQGYFLEAMGINPRIQILQKKLKEQQIKKLQSQYVRLVDPSQMGQIYKVQIITKKEYGQIYPHISQQSNTF